MQFWRKTNKHCLKKHSKCATSACKTVDKALLWCKRALKELQAAHTVWLAFIYNYFLSWISYLLVQVILCAMNKYPIGFQPRRHQYGAGKSQIEHRRQAEYGSQEPCSEGAGDPSWMCDRPGTVCKKEMSLVFSNWCSIIEVSAQCQKYLSYPDMFMFNYLWMVENSMLGLQKG